LQKAIYEHVISHDENSYFDLEKVSRLNFEKTDEFISKLGEDVKPALEKLGWKYKLTFGGTALFIYSTEKQPPSGWDDRL